MKELAVLLEVHVCQDGQDQNDGFQNVLPGGSHIHHLQTGREAGDDQCADQRARDRPDAAQRGGAAQDAGRNGIQFIPAACRDCAVTDIGCQADIRDKRLKF